MSMFYFTLSQFKKKEPYEVGGNNKKLFSIIFAFLYRKKIFLARCQHREVSSMAHLSTLAFESDLS